MEIKQHTFFFFLAEIEFGSLHLLTHGVIAFIDMVYFSNTETLFSETFIRFLPASLTFCSKKIGLYVRVREERYGGPHLSGRFHNQKLLVLPRLERVTGSHFLLCILPPSSSRATGIGNNSIVLTLSAICELRYSPGLCLAPLLMHLVCYED